MCPTSFAHLGMNRKYRSRMDLFVNFGNLRVYENRPRYYGATLAVGPPKRSRSPFNFQLMWKQAYCPEIQKLKMSIDSD